MIFLTGSAVFKKLWFKYFFYFYNLVCFFLFLTYNSFLVLLKYVYFIFHPNILKIKRKKKHILQELNEKITKLQRSKKYLNQNLFILMNLPFEFLFL